MKREDNQSIKYIFDLYKWRQNIEQELKSLKKDETLWCDIPVELQFLAKALYQQYRMNNYARLPCHVIYSSRTTLEDVKCSYNRQNQAYFECKRGFSLDLFLSKSEKYSYPSLIADPDLPFSSYAYISVLNNQYRSCTSMWGFEFNYESIIYYPWMADRDKLKLFDVTFGYDRSIYDFPPRPHLFTYVEQLKFTSQRLSFQETMNSKKLIHSVNMSDIYWTNLLMNSIRQNETINTSYIRAPIMWMNSNCNAKSRRTQYMKKLMKYIDVDNYGNCGEKIRQLPEHIVKIQGSRNRTLKHIATYNWEAGKLALSRDYLFTIAIENSLTYDYISEKLWHPLAAGSIPIYLGAPNVYDWLPCRTDCIIDLRKFETPKDAAIFIKSVAKNKTLYESYHQWRKEPVSNKFQNILNYYARSSNHTLDCALCEMSHRVGQGEDSKKIKTDLKNTIGSF
ncbi:unnamed protein product [Adineta steineri]|uniref:Fucosyltransferase n=3 Tax=Adineta steineri TaxID=433720 RepID=A0A819L3D0_9BILA|nr:unnamed protein product [Adineta steineri]CAF3958501.1 unnamed protein product [Adineta steineri]